MPLRTAARIALSATCALTFASTGAMAAACGKTSAGFDQWKAGFASEAKAAGVGQRGLQALASASYNNATIKIDRGMRSFKLSLDQFMAKRGANAIISQGKSQKAANAALFANIEKRFGVPAGPLIAIWGMETGFGRVTGNQPVVSAAATLTYDCRRPDFFRPHLIAALKLVDKGYISSSSKGAGHGEYGQTQFLPGNILKYGVDGNGDGRVDLANRADALYSTANFLRSNGMSANYQPGQGGFRALAAWNAASVYQQAIAIIGAKIDGK